MMVQGAPAAALHVLMIVCAGTYMYSFGWNFFCKCGCRDCVGLLVLVDNELFFYCLFDINDFLQLKICWSQIWWYIDACYSYWVYKLPRNIICLVYKIMITFSLLIEKVVLLYTDNYTLIICKHLI